MLNQDVLYHGSSVKVDKLIPHQAFDIGFVEGCKNAVYATSNRNMALAFALGGIPNEKQELEREMMPEFGDIMVFRKGTPNFDGLGYVYILDKNDFIPIRGSQWVCFHDVVPIKVIEIKVNDYLYLAKVENNS